MKQLILPCGMTYGGGGGMAIGEEIDSIRNWDLSSFSSRRESWIEETEDPSVIRPESVEDNRFGLPAKNLTNTFSNIFQSIIQLLCSCNLAELEGQMNYYYLPGE